MDGEQWEIRASVTDILSLSSLFVIQTPMSKEQFICESEVGGVVRARNNYLRSITYNVRHEYKCVYIHDTL